MIFLQKFIRNRKSISLKNKHNKYINKHSFIKKKNKSTTKQIDFDRKLLTILMYYVYAK